MTDEEEGIVFEQWKKDWGTTFLARVTIPYSQFTGLWI